jgi:hypothetical protein
MGAARPYITVVRLLAAAAALLFVLQGAAADDGAQAIVGNTAVEPASDYTPEGKAEAFRTTASASGSVSELRLYVDGANQASTIFVGLYSDSRSHPDALLAKGTLSNPSTGWNSVAVSPADVTAGETYWIAVLGPEGGGKPYVRDRCCNAGSDVVRGSADGKLTDLPSQWTSGGWKQMNGPFSAYGVAEIASTPPSTPTGDKSPPTAPGNLRLKAATETQIVVVWDSPSDDVGVVLYRVYRDGVKIGEGPGVEGGLLNQWTDNAGACGKSYAYAVEALDAAGNVGPKALLTTSTMACSTPTTRTQCADTLDNDKDGKIDLADPGCTSASDNDETDPTTPATQCADTLDNDKDGKIDLADPGCTSASDNDETDPPPPADVDPPTAPTNLRVTGATASSVTLAWDRSTDNIAVAGYGVYRVGVQDGTTTNLTFSVSGLSCGKAFTISVDAFDAAGNHSARAGVTTATAACTPSSGAVTVLPGQSWDSACNAASPGAVILVAPGDHGSQTLTCNKAAPGVFFRPTAGAAKDSIHVSYIDTATTNDADGVSIEGDAFLLGGFHIRNNSDRWTFRGVHVHGNVNISSATQVSIIGGEIERVGDTLSSDPQIKKATGGIQPADILIDGVNWHDFAKRSDGAHIECLQVMAGDGITIRNSRFFGCSTQGVFINEALEGVITNLLVENNWFGPTVEGYNSLIVAGVTGSAVVRQNSFAGQAPRGSTSPVTWIGNTGVLGSCQAAGSYSYNVWTNVSCGSSDAVAPVAWTNEAARNLHIKAGARAIDFVKSVTVSADIDGQSRPMGSSRDAGADEAM